MNKQAIARMASVEQDLTPIRVERIIVVSLWVQPLLPSVAAAQADDERQILWVGQSVVPRSARGSATGKLDAAVLLVQSERQGHRVATIHVGIVDGNQKTGPQAKKTSIRADISAHP
jgi:hypothetical protein